MDVGVNVGLEIDDGECDENRDGFSEDFLEGTIVELVEGNVDGSRDGCFETLVIIGSFLDGSIEGEVCTENRTMSSCVEFKCECILGSSVGFRVGLGMGVILGEDKISGDSSDVKDCKSNVGEDIF